MLYVVTRSYVLWFALCVIFAGVTTADDCPFEFAYTSSRIEKQVGIYHRKQGGELYLTADFTVAEAPSWSPDGKQIAFQAKVDNHWNIYILDVESGKSRRLTSDQAGDFHPVWSPNGSTIAFYSDRSSPERIWLVDSDGQNLREFPIEIPGITSFSWSPDGQQVVLCANERVSDSNAPRPEFGLDLVTDVFIADKDGNNLRRITQAGQYAMSPSWSPNGNQIAFALVTKPGNLTDIHIHVVNVDGTGFRKLSNDPGQNACPKWSPDGSCILFYHQPHPNVSKIPHLVRIAMDSGMQSILDVGESGGYFPDFRPVTVTNH